MNPIYFASLILCLTFFSNSVFAQKQKTIPKTKEGKTEIFYEEVGNGFSQITEIKPHPKNNHELVILEKTGKAFFYDLKTKSKKCFLDLTKSVITDSEMGLLGIAFPKDFEKEKVFIVSYNTKFGEKDLSVIAYFFFDGKNPAIHPQSIILSQEQPFKNHNGGQIHFGPDGFLYISFGDGGSGGDPKKFGQNTQSFLGKILRIDPLYTKIAPNEGKAYPLTGVERQYRIPETNPFFQKNTKEELQPLPEIYALGLRNVWKFSFDAKTKSLLAADVGQNEWEEIDIITSGKNYGWNLFEGNHCFRNNPNCESQKSKFTFPIFEYSHEEGESITGGYVYRGKKIPELEGNYIFGDFVNGKIWSIDLEKPQIQKSSLLFETKMNLSSFGEDLEGEIYFSDYGKGKIYKIRKK